MIFLWLLWRIAKGLNIPKLNSIQLTDTFVGIGSRLDKNERNWPIELYLLLIIIIYNQIFITIEFWRKFL